MKRITLATMAALATFVLALPDANAIVCARGVYRAGCAGPNGAVVARRPYHAPYYGRGGGCASGPYRAGCAGPRGAVVVRRPY